MRDERTLNQVLSDWGFRTEPDGGGGFRRVVDDHFDVVVYRGRAHEVWRRFVRPRRRNLVVLGYVGVLDASDPPDRAKLVSILTRLRVVARTNVLTSGVDFVPDALLPHVDDVFERKGTSDLRDLVDAEPVERVIYVVKSHLSRRAAERVAKMQGFELETWEPKRLEELATELEDDARRRAEDEDGKS